MTRGIVKDLSVWNKMKRNFLASKHNSINVGIFDEYYGAENDNLPVALVAQWQEEGTEKIPSRPFIRNGFIQDNVAKGKWLTPAVLQMIVNVGLGTMTWNQLYKKLGPVFVEVMKKEIEGWSIPMNAPLTIALKGRNDPLVDSEVMLNSISYRIANINDL